MRILFWNQLFLPCIGGAEILTARLARALQARGHKVAVVAARHPRGLAEIELIDGIEVHRFRFIEALSGGDLEARERLKLTAEIIAQAAQLKREFRPDVVHLNLSDPNAYFHLRTARAHEAPTVVSLQSAVGHGHSPANSLLADIIRSASKLIAPSRAGAANFASAAGVPLASIEVVAPGIPAGAFAPLPARADRANGDPPTAVFLGRLIGCKGADMAIEAVARLNGRVRLRLIGDGPERKQLENKVAARGLGPLVHFDGLVDDARRRDILTASFALLAPSRHLELFGMVAAEAALAGLPVIASEIGGLAEVVVHGGTGLLCPPGDAVAFAAAVATLLEDRPLAHRLGAAGRARALDLYSVERMIDAHERIYRESLRMPATL